MPTQGTLESRRITVEGLPTTVHVGGQGAPLLLVHGGWGSAAMHWSNVWEQLAARFQVIAPELPGCGWTEGAGLGEAVAYARWLGALLDALAVPRAWLIGNSMGAGLSWCLAAERPERCAGLVLVNGSPIPQWPALVRRLRPLHRRLIRGFVRKQAFSPAILDKAFAQPSRVPSELRELFARDGSPQLDTMVELVVRGGTPATPTVSPLIVWGEQDRLLGSTVNEAKKLHAWLPGSRLALIPGAGHLPQRENPEAFLQALTSFIDASAHRAPPVAESTTARSEHPPATA